MKKKRKWGMFEGASHIIFQRASELRNNLTPAEMALWLHLRHGIMGYKFTRQHPIGAYIADFYCFKTKLIIEIDGSIHLLPDIKELDQARQNELEELGYTILRFTNSQVLNDINKVLFVITKMLTLSSSNQSNT